MAFEYKVGDIDRTFDEKGNTFLALRKIAWGEGKPEKLDIRKWYMSSDGDETVGKGVSFITDEGPHELTRALVEEGYGHTEDVINGIKDRDDFMSSLVKCLNEDDLTQAGVEHTYPAEEYFDPTTSIFEEE